MELLVFYGDGYASGLGIDVKKYERYPGEEDPTEDAILSLMRVLQHRLGVGGYR